MRKACCCGSVAVSSAATLAIALALSPSVARASLAPGEAEQVRHEVLTAQNVGRVRALVARPDLTSAEAAAAMAAAMSTTPVDPTHAAFLHELVFGSASAASRPMLAAAVVHGLLARADMVLSENQGALERNRPALDEIDRAYALIEDIALAGTQENITDSAHVECAEALVEHFARNARVLRPEAAVAPAVASVRAQAAIALLDSLPDTPSRRVDVAFDLGLTGARRATLVDLGILVLDNGGSEERVNLVRSFAARLPGAIEGAEAVVVGAGRVGHLRARPGAVVTIDAAPPAPPNESTSPWDNETSAPPVDAATMAAARGLAAAAVRHALERSPGLQRAVDRDGGEVGVATLAGMLSVDAPRAIDTAAARLLAGKKETAAWLSDAVGALAVFSAPAKGPDGLVVQLGRGDASGVTAVRATRVALDPSGAAASLRVDGHTWHFTRDDRGAVIGLTRDAAPLSAKSLAGSRPAPSETGSWTSGGLVFARLSGSPRATLSTSSHVWVYGSGLFDAIASPAPGDDVVVEADLRVEGGPGGVVLRALPGSTGTKGAFRGVSLVILPGATARAALLVGDGFGVETAATSEVDLSGGPVQHVRFQVKGSKVEARVGSVALEATLPEGFAHGDVALRAYPGASVEAAAWRVKKP